MDQPTIRNELLQRLALVACAYEMPMTRMLNHIVSVSLDELEGKENDYTVCTPVSSARPVPDSSEE